MCLNLYVCLKLSRTNRSPAESQNYVCKKKYTNNSKNIVKSVRLCYQDYV